MLPGGRGKGFGKDGRRLMSQPRGIHVESVRVSERRSHAVDL